MQRIEIYFDFQGFYGIRQKPILIQEHRVLLIKKKNNFRSTCKMIYKRRKYVVLFMSHLKH